MASPAMADGGDGDEDHVAVEERRDGSAQPDGPDRNGGDSGRGVGSVGGHQRSGENRSRHNGNPPLPLGWKSLENGVIDVDFPRGTSDASRRLSEAVIRRTITDEQQMTQLIQQNGADLNVEPRLWVAGTRFGYVAYPLLSLCIFNLTDNSVPSIWAADVGGAGTPVAMPKWQTRGLQLAIMRALIEGGADINGGGPRRPIRVAIASCNREAFGLLMSQPGIQLPGLCVMELPIPLPTDQPTEESEAILLSFYQLLIQRDSSLATERRPNCMNPLHAAMTPPVCSQQFIDSYIDMLVADGADIRAVHNNGWTPLHVAACQGSHCVAASLCRRLTAADINRGRPTDLHPLTPLTVAAVRLDLVAQQLQNDNTGRAVRDRASIRIPNLKTTMRVLLQAGADIALMPTATEHDRRRRQLVLPEYATVLNNLPDDVMAAVNAALAPQRSLAALLGPRLAVGPQEAPIFAWRLASYLFDMAAATQTITEAIGLRHSAMARRVRAAVEHFVWSGVYEASSNREVVGGMADVGGEMVRMPLQARLDEASQHGVAGLVKGFNEHLGDDDCQFQWQQLGWVERGRDGRATFRPLQLT
ncbi:unnamed protein product [Vitrella brassicaformis CCMP3155]|uniref:Uncharacterized protein n=1 Tax=Vitrella brassicaformis (strain CCMP3155) TaxID=1169540 RepID=A0A0G4GCH9_VITBC|nr:unnamed protein product [Vitrella brassicaformis CCMP3155]|eukprot:CEM26982.1 unnamed protein product [Vitrella brassicaformis CCMP3155]